LKGRYSGRRELRRSKFLMTYQGLLSSTGRSCFLGVFFLIALLAMDAFQIFRGETIGQLIHGEDSAYLGDLFGKEGRSKGREGK
jgi:hypothetical protein